MQVERYDLDKVLVKGTVEHIRPVIEWEAEGVGARKRVKHFEVQLQEGGVLKARQVVMATGPTRAQMANIPSWVRSIGESFPEERLQHTVHLMHHLPVTLQKLKDMECQGPSETCPTNGESDVFRDLCNITNT